MLPLNNNEWLPNKPEHGLRNSFMQIGKLQRCHQN